MIIGVFTLAFLHSELGFWDYDDDNHTTHDYCDIVKTINSHTNHLRDEFKKMELNKTISETCFEGLTLPETNICFAQSEKYQTINRPSKLFIYNSSFLI